MKFKAGDKVWIVTKGHLVMPDGTHAGDVIGPYLLNSMIERIAMEIAIKMCDDPKMAAPPYYQLNIEGYPHPTTSLNLGWLAAEAQLSPRDEGYDGNKVGDWDACPYKPPVTTHV